MESNADTQRKRVESVGVQALALMMASYGTLYAKRKTGAVNEIRERYSVSKVPCPADLIAGYRKDVVLAKEMQDLFWRVQSEPVTRMIELNRLRERFNALRLSVEHEPNFDLDIRTPNPLLNPNQSRLNPSRSALTELVEA